MTIFLLRHGHIELENSETNQRKLFIGRTDVPLSSTGRRQAKMWGDVFVKKHLEKIYASDLSRCAETAEIITGRKPEIIEFIPELREINLGELEGLAMDLVREQLPEKWKDRGENIATYRPVNGESFDDLRQRVIPAFEGLVRKHDGNILIVAHAGVNRVILCHILGMPLSHIFKIDQAYGCLNILERYEDTYRIAGINLERL